MKKRSALSFPRLALALTVNALLLGSVTLGPGGSLPVRAQSAANIMASLPANAPAAAEINAFGEADRKQMPPAGAVLFIGSSSIRLWSTLAQDFSEIPVINRGFGGSLIQDSTLYADRIAIPYKPKIIVLCAGTNDLAYGNKNPQQVFQDYKDFVAKIHAALPDTRIVYLAINPTVARWKQEPRNLETNYLIEKFTVETNSPAEKLNFIDPHAQLLTADDQPQPKLLRADGLHFNADGYKVWASLVKPRVLALAALDGVKRLDAPKDRADATANPLKSIGIVLALSWYVCYNASGSRAILGVARDGCCPIWSLAPPAGIEKMRLT